MSLGKITAAFLASLILLAAALTTAEAAPTKGSSSTSVIPVGFACKFDHGQLTCGEIKGKKKKGTGGKGEHACPPGYVVLAKPNKCGSFCEPKEGDPCAPKGQTPGPATVQNVCCDANLNGTGSGPVICSTDGGGPPKTEAQIRQTFAKLFPQAKPTCKPQK